MPTATKELKLKIRIVSFQVIYYIVMFCVNHYVVTYEDGDFTGLFWIIPSFLILVFVTCNYILISQKIIQTTIFSAISASSIAVFKGYIRYVLKLNRTWDDFPPLMYFISYTLLFLLLYSIVLFIMRCIIKKKGTQVISTESVFFRKIEKIAILLMLPLVALIGYCTYINSSPERILKKQFNISLDNFDYIIKYTTRPEAPIPFDYARVYFEFNHLTQENIEHLQSLQRQQMPLYREKLLQTVFDGVNPQSTEEFYPSGNGYYLYYINSSCCGLYNKIFIVDTAKKVAVLYYQIM